MSFEAVAHAGRTVDFTVPIFEADGTTAVVLQATDVVRFKMGRGGTATLDLDSAAASANGSSVTVDTLDPASVTVRLAQDDTSSLSGPFDAEVLVCDDSETQPADAAKCAEKGVVHVVPSLDGDVGLT